MCLVSLLLSWDIFVLFSSGFTVTSKCFLAARFLNRVDKILSTGRVIHWEQNCKFNDKNITGIVDPWYWVIFCQLSLKLFCSTFEGIFAKLNNNTVRRNK